MGRIFLLTKQESGQSIIEVVLALLVVGLMVGALTIATIVGLRNAQFSQNQVQASKYAQDGIEKVRIARDRNATISSFPPAQGGDPSVTNFGGVYGIRLANYCPATGGKCYFIVDPTSFTLSYKATETAAKEIFGVNYTRTIYMEDDATTPLGQKKVTVRVSWTDPGGSHESYLQTILSKQ
jgi:type II secretory pathway pseudopilin PulG